MTDQERYAEKIAKLLRKAESTTPEEAEALIDKAQELMTQYAISEAMIREREGKPREEIIEGEIGYLGVYSKAYMSIGRAIADHHNCKCFYRETLTVPRGVALSIIGFEGDVARVKLLDSSLQIQCMTALSAWVKEGSLNGLWDNNEKTRARREFVYGFAGGVRNKLSQATRRGEAEAATEEARRSNVGTQEASESVELILRSRKDQVRDWYDERWGGKVRAARASYRQGNIGAEGAGRSAGQRANTSTRNLRPSGGALGRGH